VIDILAVVRDIAELDRDAAALEALGYESKGEFGIPGRRYFRKETPAGVRTHQLHAFAAGSTEIARHLQFRDYLRAHPVHAQAYDALKRDLAARSAGDTGAYTNGKTAFVLDIDQRAARWHADHA
jgi:GrpB-like predicted nucleotidyltransferase (UPF0157 family)